MKYKILTVIATSGSGGLTNASLELSKLVNEAIMEDWKPLGGVAIGNTGVTKQPIFSQALTQD